MALSDIHQDPPAARGKWAATFALFTSMGTLICCALPALLVTLGLGAVTAGLVSAVPQIVWLSEHKAWVFAFAGLMLSAATYSVWRARNDPCPADPAQAAACTRLRVITRWILGIAWTTYAIGFFFAYLVVPLFYG